MFNTVTNAILRDLNSNETFDLLSLSSVKIEDDLIFGFTAMNHATNINDGVHYSKTSKMHQENFHIVARLHSNNDSRFKRFINRFNADLRLEFIINGIEYFIYVKRGDQVAQIRNAIIKEYDVNLMATSRPFRVRVFGSGAEIDPPENAGRYDVVNRGYNQGVYSFDGETGSGLFAGFSNVTDGNIYFTITGLGTGNNVTIEVNGTELEIGTVGIGNRFYYSNIPQRLGLRINGINRINMLDLRNASNFTFDLTRRNNIINVHGLDNTTLILMQVVNII